MKVSQIALGVLLVGLASASSGSAAILETPESKTTNKGGRRTKINPEDIGTTDEISATKGIDSKAAWPSDVSKTKEKTKDTTKKNIGKTKQSIGNKFIAGEEDEEEETATYIVQLAGKPVVAYDGGMAGYQATKPATGEKIETDSEPVLSYSAELDRQHKDVVKAVGGKMIYSYSYSFNGFASSMTASEVAAMRQREDVLNVWEDELLQLQTDSTYEYLGLTGSGGGEPWVNGYTGEDIVIGIIDSGIYPEHPSFADVETPENGKTGNLIPYSDPPASWLGTGCSFGNSDFNSKDKPFVCNNKLLAAKCYVAGFLGAEFDSNKPWCGVDNTDAVTEKLLPDEFLSPRALGSHGTHVASTAGGNYGVNATINGESLGVVSGMAPRARISHYKVCWDGEKGSGCSSSDSMAAIDQALKDGVDVINYSVGGSSTNFNGADDVAFLYAAIAGVFVATSNGNSGRDGAQTVGTPAGVPWITAVGAAQDNQDFGAGLMVHSPENIAGMYGGLEGRSGVKLDDLKEITTDIVSADPLDACDTLANGLHVAGKIALVIRGNCSFKTKYVNAEAAGAKVIIVYNDGADPSRMNPLQMSVGSDTKIPGLMLSFADGDLLRSIADSDGAIISGSIGPQIKYSLDNRMADFSSLGPNGGAPDIIKPDVVSSGVSILAGASPSTGKLFAYLSGTSMSSPHVAGIFALLKQAHPKWTADMAKSALMTTARQGLMKPFGDEAADPFDIGSGFVELGLAINPGLVYETGMNAYEAFSCGNNERIVSDKRCDYLASEGFSFDGSNLNYPSIAVGNLFYQKTVVRTVTNVAQMKEINAPQRSLRQGSLPDDIIEILLCSVSVEAPLGINVIVTPSRLALMHNETAQYEVTLKSTENIIPDEWAFGSLTWSCGRSISSEGSKSSKSKSSKGKGSKSPKSTKSPGETKTSKSSKGGEVRRLTSGEYQVRSPIAVKPRGTTFPSEVSRAGDFGSDSFDILFAFSSNYTAGTHGLSKAENRSSIVANDPSSSYQPLAGAGAGITQLRFEYPAGTLFARFALFDDSTEGDADLDLYLWECDSSNPTPSDSSCAFVGQSGTSTSQEKIDLLEPGTMTDVYYIVEVHGYKTEGEQASFDLFHWKLSLDDDQKNMIVEAPTSATGGSETVTVTWPANGTSLDLESKYLGAVSHTGPAGLLGLTLISIDTADAALSFDFPSELFAEGNAGSVSFDIEFNGMGDYAAGTHGLSNADMRTATVVDDEYDDYKPFSKADNIAQFVFQYPPGTAFARFALFDDFTQGNDDLDIYLWQCDPSASCGFVDVSYNSLTSDEQIDVSLPGKAPDVFYVVEVHGWTTEGPDTEFTLFHWSFGFDDDRSNMNVDAPTAATGGLETIRATWPADGTSLDPESKYLGAISHTGPAGLLGLTLINIDTDTN